MTDVKFFGPNNPYLTLTQDIVTCIDPLLSNDSVNKFPWKPMCSTIERPLLGNGSVNKPSQEQIGCVFCVVRAERL
jgi:hypothetical protein